MERTEPTFVPEWLKSSGNLSTSHQSSSLHPSDEQGTSKSVRNKSLDNESGRVSVSVSDRTTSSYFRRSSNSNGSALSRSYSSFGRNNRDRDWDNNNNNNRQKDYSDPLGNILPSRFEKEGLRRSFSSVSGKRGDSWPRKVASDLSISNNKSSSSSISNVKTSFERDFPSLVTDEKQVDNNEIGRVPSPGLSSAIQSLPPVIGGDGWTSALAEVPVIVGSNGNNNTQAQVQPSSVSATTSMTGGRNMAETLAHGPPRIQTAPQLNVGTQRLEELAVKQSRQLIPMTPSMPKALADKPKLKVNQSQIVNHPHSPRPIVSIKPDVSKTSSNVGKLLVLKPSRERNGISPTTKESSSLSPTATSSAKLPNSPLAIPSLPPSSLVEKRPSSQAQSRNNFFNLMRKKSMPSNNSSGEKSGEQAAPPPPPPAQGGGSELTRVTVNQSSNGDAKGSDVGSTSDNGKNHHHDVILYSEEEEARFLRSLGWDETAEEEEGLTEEEISSFYRNYLSLKPASKFLKGTEAKLMEISSSDSKVDA